MQVSAVTRDPWETDFAALVPRFTGSLSAVSSSLIIYIILRSQTRLSSIYHRIMFGMSLADICGSIAMALTSLPMPPYMPKEEIYGYSWAGTRLGNQYTCNAQGFFATFGSISMILFNTMLCVYYACAIAFVMQEKTIKKYVEPIILAVPPVIGLGFAITPLFFELYNPAISSFAWCATFTYPLECIQYDYLECERGNKNVMTYIVFTMLVMVPLDFVVIVTMLLLVIVKVIRTERVLAKMTTVYNNATESNQEIQHMRLRHGNTKAVLVQALCYISAFLLAFLLPLLRLVGFLFFGTADDVHLRNVHAAMDKAGLVFYPLQGFFNCVIFVAFKVYNYKRFSPDSSICSILCLLVSSSAHDPAFISRISILKMDEEDQHARSAVEDAHYKVELSDEKEDERHFRLGLLNNSSNNHQNPGIIPPPPPSSSQNPNLVQMNERSLRLGLFRAVEGSSESVHHQNDDDEDEEEGATSEIRKNIQITSPEKEKMVDDQDSYMEMSCDYNISSRSTIHNHNSGGEGCSSASSSGDAYHFYPGVVEDSKAIKLQLSQQTMNYINSLTKSSRMEEEMDENDSKTS